MDANEVVPNVDVINGVSPDEMVAERAQIVGESGLKPSLFDDEASDKDCDCEEELSEDENMEVQESLTRMLQELRDEDPRDKDWLPYCESRRRDRRKPAGE